METKPENQDAKVIQSLLGLIDGERDALLLQVASLKADVDMATELFVSASTTIKELKSERARALMALEFCKNRSRWCVPSGGTNEERLSEIFHRASQIIGDDFDSYKTQLDLKPCV